MYLSSNAFEFKYMGVLELKRVLGQRTSRSDLTLFELKQDAVGLVRVGGNVPTNAFVERRR